MKFRVDNFCDLEASFRILSTWQRAKTSHNIPTYVNHSEVSIFRDKLTKQVDVVEVGLARAGFHVPCLHERSHNGNLIEVEPLTETNVDSTNITHSVYRGTNITSGHGNNSCLYLSINISLAKLVRILYFPELNRVPNLYRCKESQPNH